MFDIILTFIISFLLFGIYFAFVHFSKKEEKREKTPAVGTIKKHKDTKRGNSYYIVEFFADGEYRNCDTVCYSHTMKKYHEGDTVNLLYWKGKRLYFAAVDDDDLVPVSKTTRKEALIFLAFGAVFFAAALISLINYGG